VWRLFSSFGASAAGGSLFAPTVTRRLIEEFARRVNFIELRHDGRKGKLEDQRTDDSFQGPSTIARARDRYLVVNPDFATSTPPFTVTALQR
jgi:hypothetical protein